MVNLLMIYIITVELINGQMEEFIGDSGTKEKLMELAYFSTLLSVNHIVVNIKMVQNMVLESPNGKQDKNYHAIGKKENNMV